jgi:hypothetical protein
MPIILAILETRLGGSQFEPNPGQMVHETLSQKYPIQNRTGEVAQVIKHLSSKHEALSSNTSNSAKSINK